MEILFLGTSSGTPTKTRNVSAVALRLPEAGHWHLVDCGEGTQHRILHTSLSLLGLRAIFITHIHGDHCYGLPGLLASAGLLKRSAPLLIVGPAAVERFVRGVLESTSLQLPYALEFIDVEQAPVLQRLPEFEVRACAMSHRVPSYSYSFIEATVERRLDAARLRAHGIPSGPLWGRLQRGLDVALPDGRIARAADYLLAPRRPRRIVVGGDNDTPALLAQEAEGSDVLIHEATYTEEVLRKVGPGPQHSAAAAVARFAQEAGIGNLVLTHFSPRYHDRQADDAQPARQNEQAEHARSLRGGLSLADIEAEARRHYHGRLFLAADLERYVLDRQDVLARTSDQHAGAGQQTAAEEAGE